MVTPTLSHRGHDHQGIRSWNSEMVSTLSPKAESKVITKLEVGWGGGVAIIHHCTCAGDQEKQYWFSYRPVHRFVGQKNRDVNPRICWQPLLCAAWSRPRGGPEHFTHWIQKERWALFQRDRHAGLMGKGAALKWGLRTSCEHIPWEAPPCSQPHWSRTPTAWGRGPWKTADTDWL